MQTAKNLFLWPGRSVVRKGVEIGMALVLGKVWSKARTIEIYLNVAEWGDGIFGIEAAARRHFHKRASELNAREAALLATALPNPVKRDPARPSSLQRRHAAEVMARVEDGAELMTCLPKWLEAGEMAVPGAVVGLPAGEAMRLENVRFFVT